MTDRPDRQGEDGLSAADELFESAVLAAMHTTLSSAVIEAMTAMVRDADAGLSIQRATLPTILFAKEIIATCIAPPTRDGAEGAVLCHHANERWLKLLRSILPRTPELQQRC